MGLTPRVGVEDGLRRFDNSISAGASVPHGTWSDELVFAVADKYLRAKPPRANNAQVEDARATGAYVEQVARQLFQDDAEEPWRGLLESGLCAWRPFKGSWTRFAVAYFARLGIEFEQYVWNWNKGCPRGGGASWWNATCEGRRRFVVALRSALLQTEHHIDDIDTVLLSRLGLLKAFSKTWGPIGTGQSWSPLQTMFDLGFPERTRLAAPSKGALRKTSCVDTMLRRVARRSIGIEDLDKLTVEQATEVEYQARRAFPDLGARSTAWEALRRHNARLPKHKPRHVTLRLPALDYNAAVQLVRTAVETAFGADWNATRAGRIAVRRAMLGLSGTDEERTPKRRLHRGLETLGLGQLLVRRPVGVPTLRASAADIVCAALPKAVHRLDVGVRNTEAWAKARSDGECAEYVRWVYRELLGVERPSAAPEVSAAFLSDQRVQYLRAYPKLGAGGGLRAAVTDAFGDAEADACRWLHEGRETSGSREAGLARLRAGVLEEVGERLSRDVVRRWLRTVGASGGLKQWIERRKLVTWQRRHFRGTGMQPQVAFMIAAFAPESLRPWDVPRFGLRSASPSVVADVVRDLWAQQELDPRLDPQGCADALTYGGIVDAGLGGLLHVDSPPGKTFAHWLATLTAPQADWSNVTFADQDELVRLGVQFEGVVLEAFECAGYERDSHFDYQFRLRVQEQVVVPDFHLVDDLLAGRLLEARFVDAKLSSGTVLGATNVEKMAQTGAVLVVYAVRTSDPDLAGVPQWSWPEFANALHLKGAARQRLDQQVEAVVDRRRAVLTGRFRAQKATVERDAQDA